MNSMVSILIGSQSVGMQRFQSSPFYSGWSEISPVHHKHGSTCEKANILSTSGGYYPGKRPQTVWGNGRIMMDNHEDDDDDDGGGGGGDEDEHVADDYVEDDTVAED